MDDLRIGLKKKADGTPRLELPARCGSVTWQRQDGARGRFFPCHDLTHYAVETVLGYGCGFHGLVAAGWDLSDFGQPWRKGALPAEALPAELLVGFLDSERVAGVEWPAAQFADMAATYGAAHGAELACPVTDGELATIRARRRALLTQWAASPAGATLELRFPRPLDGTRNGVRDRRHAQAGSRASRESVTGRHSRKRAATRRPPDCARRCPAPRPR
jgi:hypothetical protein